MYSPLKVHHCDVSNILQLHAANFARESKELTGWLKISSPSLFQWLQLSGRWPLPLLSHPHKTFMCSYGKQHSDALNSNISQKKCATTKRTPWPSKVQHTCDKQMDTNVLAQLWRIHNCYLNKQAALAVPLCAGYEEPKPGLTQGATQEYIPDPRGRHVVNDKNEQLIAQDHGLITEREMTRGGTL